MTNKSKHTPGPWVISSDGKAVRSGADIMANYRRNVANVGKRDNVEEMAANLALIAAAPELLAALEDALNCMEILAHEMGKWESVKASEGFKSARAAIAKARGEK